MSLKRVIVEGAYDSKSNFRMLADRVIEPLIRIRKNASLKGSGCVSHKFAVMYQLGNADRGMRVAMVICEWLNQCSHV